MSESKALRGRTMTDLLPPITLTGVRILTEARLQPGSLSLAAGRIVAQGGTAIDLGGYDILPGIVDLHGDAFERHIAPRATAPFPIATGLAAADRDAAAHGVTTAWLAQSWSWEGGLRGPDFAEAVMAALADYSARARTDLRLQVRYETHAHDSADRLIAAVRRWKVGYVVFNNHIDEAARMARLRPAEFAGWAQQGGRTADELLDVVAAAQARGREVPRKLARLAAVFDEDGIRYGSHDDPDGPTRETFAWIGARICEFPMSLAAARVARANGNPVLMGAPNVVRGGSQTGNIAAMALIREGLCTALVSDYYYPALAQAAFRLADEGVLPLATAWAMISERPARIMGLADRGVLAPGKRADLVILDPATRTVEATITAGRIAYMSGDVALRFVAAARPLGIAAE